MMQPLDRSFFGPLKKAFAVECDKWMVNYPGRCITLHNMSFLFRCAYERVATIEKAKSGFLSSGIHPYNPDVFSDADFLATEVTNQQAMAGTNEQQDVLGHYPDEIGSCNRAIHTDNTNTLSVVQVDSCSNHDKCNEASQSDEIAGAEGSPHASTSRDDSTASTLTSVYPADICPLPKAKHQMQRRKRAKRSVIMTSSPYKNTIASITKPNRKKSKTTTIGHQSYKSSAPEDAVPSTSTAVNNNIECPGCQENYEEPPTEDWIQCTDCKQWWHEACSAYEGGDFTCDLC